MEEDDDDIAVSQVGPCLSRLSCLYHEISFLVSPNHFTLTQVEVALECSLTTKRFVKPMRR